jgi:3-carboxy-cis,cis-muconate cycloisomerase
VAPARTLGRPAVPTTFGLTTASWLDSVLDAADDLDLTMRHLPGQVGGAAGTLAAISELFGDPQQAMAAAGRLASTLGLLARPPWHTHRRPLTRAADALVACSDAWGRIANDVLLRSRPEFGELDEASAGRGGSSTLPGKTNPVLSVLIRRAALCAPGLGAQLHLAAANTVDQRPDGAWHTEWAPLRTLARRAVVAAEQTTELLDGLVVHADRMRSNAEAAAAALLAERTAMREVRGLPERKAEIDDYLGAAGQLIDAVLARAARHRGAEAHAHDHDH